MPYKLTGRPNGRPRKKAQPETAEAVQPPRVNLQRARARFRNIAEALNPSPFITVYDQRGRARHAPRHSNVKV